MKKNKIELNILIFILIEAFFLLFFYKESFLNIIVGSLLGLLLTFLFKKLKFKSIIKLLILFTAIFLAYMVAYKSCHYISYNILKHFPISIIIISFIFTSLYLSIKGYHTYIKTVEITSYFFIFIKLLSFILIIFNINTNNINYLIIKEESLSIHSIYISLTILFIYLTIKYLTLWETSYKSYLISILNPIVMKIITILTIGMTLFNIYDYPYVNVLKRIKYLDFIERMEGILSFQYLISFILLESFLLLIIISIIKKDSKLS